MKILNVLASALSLISISVYASDANECHRQTVEKTVIEMCLVRSKVPFEHDLYTLRADRSLIFMLIDDYVEKVELQHTIPPGLTIELPLSKQSVNPIKIYGGCVPESDGELEVARLCNFHWGRFQIVKDVRFRFD